MSRRLIGTLTDPSGTSLAGWLLTLDARRNSAPTVPIGATESVVLDVSGGYDLLITDGLYMALLTAPGGTIQRRIGLFLVAPGADIDILTLIELYIPPGSPGAVGLSLAVSYEGVQLTGSAASLNFTGAGVLATAVGGAVTADVTGGGGGGGAWGAITGTLADQTDLQTALDGKQSTSEKGAANGYASLDAGGTVPDAQLPAGLARDSEVTAAVAAHAAAADPHTQYATDTDLSTHTVNTSNPHSVTKAQVGLGSADNTSDASKPVSTAQQTALNLKQDASAKDASGGYAGLTLFKLNLRNAANTITSFFTTAATVARTWTLPDKDGTVAMLADSSYLGEFTFATIPSASGNARKMVTLTDSAFGPGVLVQSDGTRWRPVGDQMLSSGPSSELTLQNTAETAMLVIGPFPGGFVKSGDALLMNVIGRLPGVGAVGRSMFIRIGAAGTIADPQAFVNTANLSITTQSAGNFSIMPVLFAASDTNAEHYVNWRYSLIGEFGLYPANANTTVTQPTIDFSAPWYVTLSGRSFAETAVNITSSSWSGGVATHVSTAHTLNTGDKTTIASVSLAGYNAEFSPVTRIDANTFSVPLAADPGGAGTGGTTRRVSNVILQRYSLRWSS